MLTTKNGSGVAVTYSKQRNKLLKAIEHRNHQRLPVSRLGYLYMSTLLPARKICFLHQFFFTVNTMHFVTSNCLFSVLVLLPQLYSQVQAWKYHRSCSGLNAEQLELLSGTHTDEEVRTIIYTALGEAIVELSSLAETSVQVTTGDHPRDNTRASLFPNPAPENLQTVDST
jgi:hypothetical protein